jgi:hypothetical protein
MTARCQDREHHHLHGRSANADGETGPGAKLAATGLLCSMPAGADNVTALLPMGTAEGRSRRPAGTSGVPHITKFIIAVASLWDEGRVMANALAWTSAH